MNSLKSTSKILLVVAALSMTAVGCDRRAGDTSGGSGASGTSSSGAGSMGSSGSGAGGAGGAGGTSGSGTGSK